MNDRSECLLWLMSAAIALSLTACSGETDDGANACGEDGDEITVEEETYCVYQQPVVVENGFECPPDNPNLITQGGIGVCTSEDMLPEDRLREVGERYRDENPEFEGCIFSEECAAGQICEVGACEPETNNATTNNSTTNGATNGGVECSSDTDCADLQRCVDGVCLGVCGGFGGFTCEDDEWCDYPNDSICGAADQRGVCRPRPESCNFISDPVCGCDGVDYGNECDANLNGVDVATEGTCQ